MARLRQLSDLQNDCYKLADLENATALVPSADVTEYINQGWTRVYALLCETGENYYLSQLPTIFNTVAGKDTYYTIGTSLPFPVGTNVLPADIWRIRGIDLQIQAGRFINAQPYEFEQRNDYQASDWSWPLCPFYDFQGSGLNAAIRFIPPASTALPVRLWYWPNPVRLANPTDTFDGGNGWELMAIAWAARRMAIKDENYDLVGVLDRELADFERQIRFEAQRRNAGVAPKMRRVRYKKNWPWPGGGAGRF